MEVKLGLKRTKLLVKLKQPELNFTEVSGDVKDRRNIEIKVS
jgi:hypothetical protein